MTRFARVRKRTIVLVAAATLTASAGTVVAALVMTPPPEPQRHVGAPRDLGAPAAMSPADDAGPACRATAGVCVRPSGFGVTP